MNTHKPQKTEPCSDHVAGDRQLLTAGVDMSENAPASNGHNFGETSVGVFLR